MVRAGWVAGCGPDASVLLGDELGIAQLLVGRIAPKIHAHTLVQAFGKGFGQAVGEGFEHDGGIIIMVVSKLGFLLFDAQTGGDGEEADVVRPHALGRDEVGQAAVGPLHPVDCGPLALQAQRLPAQQHALARLVGIDLDDIVVHRVGRQERDHAAGL